MAHAQQLVQNFPSTKVHVSGGRGGCSEIRKHRHTPCLQAQLAEESLKKNQNAPRPSSCFFVFCCCFLTGILDKAIIFFRLQGVVD